MQVKFNLDGVGNFIERRVVRHSEITAVERKISVNVHVAVFHWVESNGDSNGMGDSTQSEVCIHMKS